MDFIKTTEQDSNYNHLEKMNIIELLININAEDQTVPVAVEKAIPQIEKLVKVIVHQLNQGVFKKLIDYFEDCLTTISKTTLDKFVRYLAMNSHCQSTRDYPRGWEVQPALAPRLCRADPRFTASYCKKRSQSTAQPVGWSTPVGLAVPMEQGVRRQSI